MSGIVFAGLSPHPPMLIPEIGRDDLRQVKETQKSMREFAKRVKKAEPDLIITISPHGPVFSDAISILNTHKLHGDFGQFGFPEIELSYNLQEDIIKELVRVNKEEDITVARIDQSSAHKLEINPKLGHGVLVPLYYLEEAGITDLPLVPVTMGMLPYEDLYKFGKIVQLAAMKLGYRVAIIASGDLSHRLTPEAPAGFNPQAKEFDQKLVQALAEDRIEDIFALDRNLIEKAGECGLRPIMIMLGAIDGLAVKPELLSYEGPFGVGYGVITYEIDGSDEERKKLNGLLADRQEKLEEQRKEESDLVRLARKAVEQYALNKELISVPDELTDEMKKEAGVFVSIKKYGQLRGCIGTIEPVEENVAAEIIRNAYSAGFKDPRFPAVNLNELEELTYSVDILEEPESIELPKELDPRKYGVIVRKGQKSGLLLPRLDGVDTVDKQLEIAKRKAGIPIDEEDVELMRFRVTRYE